MRLPIGLVLAAAMGASLVVAAGGTIGYLSVVATQSTGRLIADKGRLTAARSARVVEGEMLRVRDQAEALAGLIADAGSGAGGPLPQEDLEALVRPVLDASAAGAGVIHRAADGGTLAIGPEDTATVAGIDVGPAPARGWGEPLRLPAGGPLGLPFTQALPDGGTVSVLLDLDRLSRRLAEAVGGNADTAFLIDGDRMVLAHSRFREVPPGAPLGSGPADPVLGMIAHPSPHRAIVPGEGPEMVVEGTRGPMFAISWLPLGPDGRFLAGSYYEAGELGAPGDAVETALIGSGVLLVLVIGGAFLLGSRIGRPIRSLAKVAKRMETLAVQDAPRLPRSSLREIDDANQAVNAAIGGLGAFSRYVPRDLVLRLLKPDAIGALHSTTREVTILFTDIAGYTAAASKMTAEETAAFLNHHFELLTACVEAEGGTVDKFIGDSLMAFWGAPEPQADHPARAVRAARAMAAAVSDDEIMAATGARLRIGLHSGTVVVGNVGATSRTSYTVIGDAVNVAARLEQLGKQIDPAAGIIALTSAETDARLPAELRGTSVGRHLLRGREDETEVMRLV